MSAKKAEFDAAVNIEPPDDNHALMRLNILLSIAKTCERLGYALNCPVQTVTINGDVIANAPVGLRTDKRKPRSA